MLAQASGSGSGDANVAAIAALVTAVAGLLASGYGVWRGVKSDRRDEIAELRTENRQLRDDVDRLYGRVNAMRQHIERCEEAKARLERQLADVIGGLG